MIYKSVLRLRPILDALLAPIGLLIFATTGRTPAWASHGLIRLFCATGGHWNDWLSRLNSIKWPPRAADPEAGVFGKLSTREARSIAEALREKGYFVLVGRVPEDICERLVRFALTTPSLVRPSDANYSKRYLTTYDPSEPLAVRYDLPMADVINHSDVQALMADPALLNIAREYLQTEPIADVTGMWWHTAFSKQPDSEAAQFYHFDMDRIKWLKIFVYLTDVDADTGPHCFISGSHRTGGIPRRLLAKGYARLEDADVARCYEPDDFIKFKGPRGTVIVEDTRGLHKGENVRTGHRLILQLQFSNSLFGPEYPKVTFSRIHSPRIAAAMRYSPRIFSNYAPKL